MRGKKGGEKYLSIWWFFVLVIIGGGVVIAVSSFNVSDISVKEIESDILISKIVDCVVDNGYIKQEFLQGSFDIFDECHLSKEVIDKQGGKHYLAFEVYELEKCDHDSLRLGKTDKLECEQPLVSQSFGVASFKEQCRIKEKLIEAKHYPECSEKFVYVLNGDEKLVFYLIAGSNQETKREVRI